MSIELQRETPITINGQPLSEGQAMSVRVAVEAYLVEMSQEGALGEDERGEGIRQGYLGRLTEVRTLLMLP